MHRLAAIIIRPLPRVLIYYLAFTNHHLVKSVIHYVCGMFHWSNVWEGESNVRTGQNLNLQPSLSIIDIIQKPKHQSKDDQRLAHTSPEKRAQENVGVHPKRESSQRL